MDREEAAAKARAAKAAKNGGASRGMNPRAFAAGTCMAFWILTVAAKVGDNEHEGEGGDGDDPGDAPKDGDAPGDGKPPQEEPQQPQPNPNLCPYKRADVAAVLLEGIAWTIDSEAAQPPGPCKDWEHENLVRMDNDHQLVTSEEPEGWTADDECKLLSEVMDRYDAWAASDDAGYGNQPPRPAVCVVPQGGEDPGPDPEPEEDTAPECLTLGLVNVGERNTATTEVVTRMLQNQAIPWMESRGWKMPAAGSERRDYYADAAVLRVLLLRGQSVDGTNYAKRRAGQLKECVFTEPNALAIRDEIRTAYDDLNP